MHSHDEVVRATAEGDDEVGRRRGAADDVRLAEAVVGSGGLPEPLRHEFAALGLSPYELRVLLALMRLGSANTLQLSRVADVPRTSCYQVLESLVARRLAVRLPGERVAMWAAAEREDVFERLEAALEAAHAERLREHRDHAAAARTLLDAWAPQTHSVALPYVHMLTAPPEVKHAYDEMLAGAQRELLMFTRPPYVVVPGQPKSPVLEMLARGVEARVLYQADKWEEPEAHAARQELSAYHEAGVQARMVDSLPIKLVIVDRRVTLVGMTDPVAPEAGYPIALLIEHPGYAAIEAQGFERLWDASRPLSPVPSPTAKGEVIDLGDLEDLVELRDLD
ncbi:MAG: TrmB family transcriptional regulator [Nocardioidaceae bacterium]